MGGKYLSDIAAYFAPMHGLGLPRDPYTTRDVKSGAVFVASASERSATYAALLLRRVLLHLAGFGFEVARVVVQMDRGAEFGGGGRRSRERGFIDYTVEELCGTRPPLYAPALAERERGRGGLPPAHL